MSADLHIHILEGITIETLKRFQCNTLGTVFFDPSLWQAHAKHSDEDHNAVEKTPSVWVGEVSWLKAAVFNDPDSFIPNPIEAVAELFKQGVVDITDELIERVEKALERSNQTAYRIERKEPVVDFLKEHKGKKAFTISW